MIRIFSILSAVAVLIMVITGVSTYWISISDVDQAKEETILATAKGIAQGISSQIGVLQETLSSMSTAPEVISAVETNSLQMGLTAARLEKYLPEVMKIRIFPANVRNLDDSTSTPLMGNADLIMVQETLKRYQQPVIQGQGENRHLAMTAAIKKAGDPIGVILASQKFDFLQSIITKSRITKGYIELQQGTTTLAKFGDESDKTDVENTINIPKTFWKLYYWPEKSVPLSGFKTIAGLIVFAALIICLTFFVFYRNTTRIMRQDLSSILNSVKDLMAGKNIASHAVNLNEMKAIVSTIIQYKRVLDSKGIELSTEIGDDTEFDDFFDETTDVSILDSFANENESSSNRALTEGTPISLPISGQSSTETPQKADTETQSLPVINAYSLLFQANDIRGIAGEVLTKEIVFDIGRAIGSEAIEKNINTIVVGRDGRTSSPELSESLTEGIISTGVSILDLGLVPSPVVYFVSQHTEGRTGVVVTGSHNPAEYNGLKIIINGETLSGKKIIQLKQRIDSEDFVTASSKGSIEQNDMFVNEYIGTISEDIHIVRPMKVVVDCGNGAAGELAPVLLKTLGCEVIELFCDIDGKFPNHHPDPSKPENLSDLISSVKLSKADVGFAFDGDGDRLGVVDSKGKIIWPDRQMMLFAKNVLALKPGSEIIYDVKCSRHLGELIAKNGGRPLMWKTGHAFMKNKLRETGAALAGEMSGHFFFNDRWFGFDDALYSASRLIEILSADTRNSDEVFAELPDSINTPEITIEVALGENMKIMEKLMAAANFKDGKIISIDGMRVDFADGWGLVRASNSMPALVLRFEANTAEALTRIQSEFKKLFTKVVPDMALPF